MRWRSPSKLNPENEPGRLTFITRMGAGQMRELLPELVEKVTAAGVEVAWVCDPMHGNTFETSTRVQDPPVRRRDRRGARVLRGAPRARHLARRAARGAHRGRRHRVRRRGRGADGGRPLASYETVCDPRLNRVQSLELAFLVAEMLRARS